MKINPINTLNEPRTWSSYEEVITTFLAASDAAENGDYAFKQDWAVSTGVRNVERVLQSIEEEKQDARFVAASRDAIINNRSVVDIAIIGIMISLGETSKYADPTAKTLQGVYKTKEIASDVEKERKRALDALEILLKLKADGAKLANSKTSKGN